MKHVVDAKVSRRTGACIRDDEPDKYSSRRILNNIGAQSVDGSEVVALARDTPACDNIKHHSCCTCSWN